MCVSVGVGGCVVVVVAAAAALPLPLCPPPPPPPAPEDLIVLSFCRIAIICRIGPTQGLTRQQRTKY